MKRRSIMRIVGIVAVFTFISGFATNSFMKAFNISLVSNNAFALTPSGEDAINKAKEYEGKTNSEICNGKAILCQSAWCASFVTLVLAETGVYNPILTEAGTADGPGIRVEEYVACYIKDGKRFHFNSAASDSGFSTYITNEFISSDDLKDCKDGYIPETGDLILFDWGHDGMPDHIGFFISNNESKLKTIEGNPGNLEWYETKVQALENNYSDYESLIFGYIHPHYSEETEEERVAREEREVKEREAKELKEYLHRILFGETEESPEYYTVTFNPGEGTVKEASRYIIPRTCSVDEFPQAVPNDPTMQFIGWFLNDNDVEYTHDSWIESDITLTARYESIPYTIMVEAKKFNSPNTYDIENPDTDNNSENTNTSESFINKLVDSGVGVSATTSNAVEDILLGDVDKSGKIDANDASMLLIISANTNTGTSISREQLKYSDVNSDGVVTPQDAAITLSYYSYLMSTNDNPVLSLSEFIDKQ